MLRNWTHLASFGGIKLIKPNIYCKGKDYKDASKDITNKIKKEIMG